MWPASWIRRALSLLCWRDGHRRLKDALRSMENLEEVVVALDMDTSLRYLSDELRIRAAGLRVHQKAA